MNILIPIVGSSPFFPPEEFAYPRPLIEICGKPIISWVVENLATVADDPRFFFVASAEEAINYSYPRVFSILTKNRSETIMLKRKTGGALCSCLCAIDMVPPDQPLIIANSDQIIDADLSEYIETFKKREADAGVVTFESVHPRWSYVKVDEGGEVGYAAEKHVISNNAIAGFYYFRQARDFFDAAQSAILNKADHNGQYYVSSSLNELVLAGKRLSALEIDKARYHSFYHPKQIESFERAGSGLLNKFEAKRKPVQLVIPAAGNGSRFADAGYAKVKPFIDVDGAPMIERVIGNLDIRGGELTVILRSEHIEAEPQAVADLKRGGVRIVAIDRLTEGTACTLLRARSHIDNDKPLLIANSDQLVDYDVGAMIDECYARDLDGMILTFKDADKNPKWSFAKIDANGIVETVAEKNPISDLATVGIYFFRKGSDFVRAAIDMIARNDRVNNEFYVCPVYNYAIAAGLRFGVSEIAPDQMHGIGTPEDLTAYLEKAKAGGDFRERLYGVEDLKALVGDLKKSGILPDRDAQTAAPIAVQAS